MIPWEGEVALAAERLEAAGYEVYLVGGSLRDALLGLAPKDYDLATDATPSEVARVFAGERVVETGLRHGTLTVFFGKHPLEITTYRAEGAYSDGRRPDAVYPARDIREDLARRDFTMNALAYHPVRGLVDPFGGKADLEAGIIRCVGEPARRFGEDGLRILRALRFASVLGFSLEEETRAALLQHRGMRVSAERISAELCLLLCGKAAAEVLLDYVEVFGEVIPALLPLRDFWDNPHRTHDLLTHTARTVSQVPPEPALRLAALLRDVAKPLCRERDAEGLFHFRGHAKQGAVMARRILQDLRMEKATVEQVVLLVSLHDLPLVPENGEVRRLLGRLPPPLFFSLLELKVADTLARTSPCAQRLSQYREVKALALTLLEKEGVLSRERLAVKGHDLRARGLQGKEIGRRLQLLLDAVIAGEVENERAALLAYLEEEQNFFGSKEGN